MPIDDYIEGGSSSHRWLNAARDLDIDGPLINRCEHDVSIFNGCVPCRRDMDSQYGVLTSFSPERINQ